MTRQADLTHAEAQAAFKAFVQTVGPKASCSVHLSTDTYAKSGTLHAFLQPKGYRPNGVSFMIEANSYRDLLGRCEAKWAEHSDLHAANTIREMALKIISITADQGECTDAALRATFDAVDVARYGERACAQATEMASNGPFSIVKLAGANQNEAA